MLSQKEIDSITILYQQGHTKSEIAQIIGCSRQTITRYIKKLKPQDPMIGKQFGRLTVLEQLPKDPQLKSRCLRYKCKCECGNIIEVNGNSLRTGHTTSCGCSRKGKLIKDLTGKRFGMLTVESFDHVDQNRHSIWKCRCDCGNITYASSNSLNRHTVTSCGCKKMSSGEAKINDILQQMNVIYACQYKIEDCCYKEVLPFDFAIFNNNNQLICLIEYQGDIHFKSTGGWNTEERLQLQRKRDQIKRDYCEQHNIKLIEISYTDYDILNKEYLRKVIYD